MVTKGISSIMADIERRVRRLHYAYDRVPLDRRIFRDRTNPLETLSRDEVRERYRFYPETIMFLVGIADLGRATGRSCSLPPLIITLAALHFFATGTHHIVTATLHGISRASVSRAVKEFTEKFCSLLDRFVCFPNDEKIRGSQKQFYNIAGFPHVVGAVDGTQIRIQAPSQHEDDYMNRKGFHSINVQMICDATFRIIDVVAKWPGSVHDSRMFRESNICQRFETGLDL